MSPILKKIGPDAVAIVAFVILAFAYFYPSAIDGRVLSGTDHTASAGLGAENDAYYKETGHVSRWTNAAFSGMPTYQINPSYPSTQITNAISTTYKLFLPGYVGLVFIMLLGFYILMRAFNFKVWMSALGAILWAFSSYYFIIILAGHIWKFITLAYIPPTIAGMVLAYRGKYLAGGLLTALFASFQIASNHVQMSYYFLFVMFFMVLAYLWQAIREHQMPRFWKATGVMVVAGVAAVLINGSNLYHTWEYSKHTMREKSELVKPNTANQTNSGLDRDYITAWSYGKGETFSLMIPNIKGGASQIPLQFSEENLQLGTPQLQEFYRQPLMGQYWGEQPGTSGPVYVGAFVCLLFILGLLIVKGPMKWALLAATVLSILLSWGHNLMWFTNLFIDHFPMYAKFRTVSSILVIAEFTIPLLALLALRQWLDEFRNGTDEALRKQYLKRFYTSLGVTGGLCLLFALFPSLIEFNVPKTVGQFTARLAGQASPEMLSVVGGDLSRMLPAQYSDILSADAWRSLFIILLGAALLWLYAKGKLKGSYAVAGILVLCLADMWSVNKRYLNDDCFVEPRPQEAIAKSAADEQILQDTDDPDYRVLDLSVNVFNDNTPGLFHKNIGGYHPAKLRRYQELIDYHISPEIQKLWRGIAQSGGDLARLPQDSIPVLNMLNMRYVILPVLQEGGQKSAIPNPNAYGNAWFVSDILYAKNANEEIEALYDHSPRRTAVVSEALRAQLGPDAACTDSAATIRLTEYAPDRLVYETNSKSGGVALFSEIYYPEWTVSIDGGEPSEEAVFQANYVLRGVKLPAGRHTVEVRFDPASVHRTEALAYAGFALLLLFLGGTLWQLYRGKHPSSPQPADTTPPVGK